MTERVVVLGAGYAGAGAVKRLETELDDDAELTWVADHDYHLVLHESHRVIRDPSVRDRITIPVGEIKSPGTAFVEGTVTGVDVEARSVELESGATIDYDYLLVALGSDTAFYGIPGMEEHAHTLENLDDALAIHDGVRTAARDATYGDPAEVVIGGCGLSGIQIAGEIAEYRDREGLPVEITLVEALEEIMPGSDDELQARVRDLIEERDIDILTDDPITEADPDRVHFDEREPVGYDVLIWTGGITGRDALASASVEKDHNRVNADATFRTSDDRVFAIGDSAVIDLGNDTAPPTAQAAWQAAEVVGANIAREIDGVSLEAWEFEDKGTLISVGEEAVAHDVVYVPVRTFGGAPARFLKKLVAARWIADVTSWPRALSAWSVL